MLYRSLVMMLCFIIVFSANSFAACGLLCSCSILSGGAMNFGAAFNPTLSGNTDVTGSFTIRCTAVLGGVTADYSVALSSGNSANFNSRTMLNNSTPLAYNLYTSAARNQIWGDGSQGTGVVTGQIPILILSGVNRVVDVYGRITGPQPLVTPGSYQDQLTITLTF